ncbi:MAG TPA: hemerythrin domain-containing protein, partial [Burkholderiales bacterium]|nr:hemerythrin domain-containing protein [Burkholderiales bacterium]
VENIYDALRESHKRQRGLCRKILRINGSVPEKQRAFKELWVELEAHAAAEERFLGAFNRSSQQVVNIVMIAEHSFPRLAFSTPIPYEGDC